jgi:4-hydroxybenzoyl-CoA thioesterase
MSYTRQIRVEFNHCDPAGIVFYPRYYEMMNSVCENFFRDRVGVPFEAMVGGGHGVPTARAETDFRAPSRLGEVLDWALSVERVGGSSATFRLTATCAGEHRLTAILTLVWVAGGRPERWPDAMRAALATEEEAT